MQEARFLPGRLTKSIGARDRLPAMASARRRAVAGRSKQANREAKPATRQSPAPQRGFTPDFVNGPAVPSRATRRRAAGGRRPGGRSGQPGGRGTTRSGVATKMRV